MPEVTLEDLERLGVEGAPRLAARINDCLEQTRQLPRPLVNTSIFLKLPSYMCAVLCTKRPHPLHRRHVQVAGARVKLMGM